MTRRDSEERIIRQLRSGEERKALARMAEIAESGGVLTTAKDLEEVLIALRVSGKRFDSVAIQKELERGGWITRAQEKIIIKKAIPLTILGQFFKK